MKILINNMIKIVRNSLTELLQNKKRITFPKKIEICISTSSSLFCVYLFKDFKSPT